MSTVEERTENAADEVFEAISFAGWRPRHVIIASVESDPLWEAIESRFAETRIKVTRSEVPPMSRSKSLISLAGSCGPGDLVIIHDDVRAGPTEEICEATRLLCRTGALVMFLEFPSNVALSLSNRLRRVYLEALSCPVSLLVSEMDNVRRSLRKRKAQLLSGDSSLTFYVDAIFDDFTVLTSGPQILQLPLGEVWMLVRDATGELEIDLGRAGHIRTRVANGTIFQDGTSVGPLVEIGIGVNPHARVIPSSLCEKVAGRIHAGLGDDELIGGQQARTWHSDLHVAAGARLEWL